MTTHVRRRSLVQSCFINTTKYDLSKESDRRASFIDNGYSNEAIPIEDLALMGFYFYKRPDVVKCAFCYVSLENFECGDTALGEHLKFSPNCPLLVKRRSTGNVPMDDKVFRQRVPSVSSFDECGSKRSRRNSKQDYLEYPEYRLLQKRLNSFETWPIGIKQKPLELANAGFFYSGQSDLVICFTCGVYLNQWESTDNPWVEHKKLATKECNYLALNHEIVKKEEEKYEQFKKLQATENEINALNINDKEEESVEKNEVEPNFETLCKICLERKSHITHVITMMKDSYTQVRICPYRGDQTNLYSDGHNITSFHAYCDLRLEPDLTSVMERSRNERELRYVWTEFRKKIGPPIRNRFIRYIDLANQAAVQHGFRDAGEQMRDFYEDPDFFFTVQDLWTQVQPLYKQLFSFVRRGLYIKYGDNVLRSDGPIPAHILGNMWGQNRQNIIDLIKPHMETPDVTGEMVKQGYTPMKIFQVAEEFFTSLGLPPMSPEFLRNSIIQKPNDVYGLCAASAIFTSYLT